MNQLDFPAWLQSQLDERDWYPTDLAKRAKISDAAVSRILRGERKASPETLKAFAKALDIPSSLILQAAGISEDSKLDDDMEKIIHEIVKLPKDDQREVLAFIRMKNNLRKK